MIKYCRSCVMPETKPDILFDDEQVCSACRHFTNRDDTDWIARRTELEDVLDRYRGTGSNYDCVIPVSGGKDSTFQVIRMLELGARPLCVTATTDHLTELGRRNIENIKALGVDHIEVSTNPVVRRKINKLALTQVGDIAWPEHVTIFTIPVRIAVQMNIPLIVWGENSQNEYGGPAAAAADNTLTRRWLEEFGGLLGLRVSDLAGQMDIAERDLIQYTYPTDHELARIGVSGIFLGYYLPWDGAQNAMIAQGYGFEAYPTPVEGGLLPYENLDNAHHRIHDYFKFLKYGFARATDHACMAVRRGRMSRHDAVALVERHDGKFPWSYLGVELGEILDSIDMTLEEFQTTCDRFTNKAIFKTNRAGELVRETDGSLIKLNHDNLDEDATPQRRKDDSVESLA